MTRCDMCRSSMDSVTFYTLEANCYKCDNFKNKPQVIFEGETIMYEFNQEIIEALINNKKSELIRRDIRNA